MNENIDRVSEQMVKNCENKNAPLDIYNFNRI
jgi:hypothetical protein